MPCSVPSQREIAFDCDARYGPGLTFDGSKRATWMMYPRLQSTWRPSELYSQQNFSFFPHES